MAREPRGRVRSNSGGSINWGRRGRAEGFATAEKERQRAANRRNNFAPFRFGLENGTRREIIILDTSMDDLWYMYEHTYYNANKNADVRFAELMCCREEEECPICEKVASDNKSNYNHSSFTMFLTVLELADGDEPIYTDKAGNEHFHTKRLMAVKASQATELERFLDLAEKENGTLRGTILVMERDNGNTSPRIGKPTLLDNGKGFDFIEEAALIEDFGHDAIVGDDGKEIRPADDDITPYAYGKLFPKPTPQSIADSAPTELDFTAGSQADIDRTLNEDDDQDGEQEERPRRGAQRSRRSGSRGTTERRGSSSRSHRSSAPAEGGDEGEQEEAPARTRARVRSRSRTGETASAPAGRSRSRSRTKSSPADDLDDEIPF